MPSKEYSKMWLDVEEVLSYYGSREEYAPYICELDKDSEERIMQGIRDNFPINLLEELSWRARCAERRYYLPPSPVIHSVWAIYDRLVDSVKQIKYRQDRYEIFNKKNPPNLPVLLFWIRCASNSFSFRTIRKNETVQVDIVLRELRPRFYDKKDDDSLQFCLEVYIHKKLVNPGKFQQEFSLFLASEKHLFEFIFDTVWPHIDAAVERDKRRAQTKLNRENQKKVPRKKPRYCLRARKTDEKSHDVENSRENHRKNRHRKNRR